MKHNLHKDLHKFAFWIKFNNLLMGHSFIVSFFFVTIFCLATVLLFANPSLIDPYLKYYYMSFPAFIIALWLLFVGFLLRLQ